MAPQPFTLSVPDAAIADLKTRLALTRFPDAAPGEPWAFGTSVDYARDLVGYWKDRFDWRAQEAALNAFPQFKTPLHDIDLHYLHVPGVGPNPYPLLLLHGWPGSVFEFLDIIPRLTDPARFGGDPKDAFTVIAPSLPGYGLSFTPGQKRFTLQDIAACVHDLMTDVLGFKKFAVQGGDWGAGTASLIGHTTRRRSAASTSTCCSSRATGPKARCRRRRNVTPTTSRTGCGRKPATSKSRAPNRKPWPLV